MEKIQMARLAALFAAFALAVLGVFAIGVGTSSAGTPCVGKYDIVVGGFNWGQQDSTGFGGSVDQRVSYNSFDTQGGANELNRLVREHRSQCPGDHITAVGHSGGAAAVHVWISQQGNLGNENAVLLADPKRAAGPGGPGFAQTDWPFNVIQPLAGSDANFRGVPVLTICNHDDHICNSQADWSGYQNGRHGAYDFNVDAYSTSGSGVRFQ